MPAMNKKLPTGVIKQKKYYRTTNNFTQINMTILNYLNYDLRMSATNRNDSHKTAHISKRIS